MQVNLNTTFKSTNYPQRKSVEKYKMQNNAAPYTPSTNNSITASDINFAGFGFIGRTAQNSDFTNFIVKAAHYLEVSPNKLRKYITPKEPMRMKFFHALTENYVADLHNLRVPDSAQKDIEKLYNLIGSPQDIHFSLLNNKAYSFAERYKMLELSSRSKYHLDLLGQLQTLKDLEGRNLNLPGDTVFSVLSSDNVKNLSENFENFRSYIVLNHENKDFVKNLLREIATDQISFNPKELDKTLSIKSFQKSSIVLEKLPAEFLAENYNILGLKLLSSRIWGIRNLIPKNSSLTEEEMAFYKYLINSTNEGNFSIRKDFFEHNAGFVAERDTGAEVMEFFKRMDQDEDFREIYKYAAKNSYSLMNRPISELMFYVDSFGSDVLVRKLKNFIRIINSNTNDDCNPEKMIDILSENLNNNFYITKDQISAARKDEFNARFDGMFLGTAKSRYKRAKRIIFYKIMPEIFGKGKPTPIKQRLRYRAITDEPLMNAANQVDTTPQTPKIKVKRDYKAMKLKIKQEGQEIIKSRMRFKNGSEPEIKRYTKIKNGFLNEMFDSVKEVRAKERAEGKKTLSVSNKHVLELYSKITGKNKKLVKELLTKRDEAGNRLYTVRQISRILDELNIQNAQKVSKKK